MMRKYSPGTLCRGLLRVEVVLMVLAVAAGAALIGPSAVFAQNRSLPAGIDTTAARRLAEEHLGRGVTQSQVIEKLRNSGASRMQVRAQLQQMGYDPALADQYFDMIESGALVSDGEVQPELLQGLQRMGLSPTGPEFGRAPGESWEQDWPYQFYQDTLGLDSVEPGEEIFGRSLFRRATTQFFPVLTGPASPDYRLGPGDEIVLVLTGDVEFVYTLPITSEGLLIIPDVGQISVNGLTLAALEDVLYGRLGRVYSGIRRSSDATARFHISLGRLRMNQVYLVGEVERPSAYGISAAATVFDALYRAGGPNSNGSFRKIQVWRGGEVVRTVDLYDYLLHGDSKSDIRLEQGDIVFVPPYSSHVQIAGAVRRPAIYEVLQHNSIKDLIGYAGGFRADAVVRRVQIDRILLQGNRRPGVERALTDVDLSQLDATGEAAVMLQDGDLVQVFAVTDERRHRIVVTGEVRRPGAYEWGEGLTLWDLIDRAEGLDERAYTPRGHIYRLNEEDGSRRLIQTPLLADSTGLPLQDVMLVDRDSVVVYSRAELRNPELVLIDGFVKNPGYYDLATGMSIPDLILAAGGFIPGAYQWEAEVARLPQEIRRTDQTARIFRVSLESGARAGAERSKAASGGFGPPAGTVLADSGTKALPVWVPEPDEFPLRHGDQVFIRKAPGYDEPRAVQLSGQVLIPGTYVLETRQERLLDLIERAGGLTDEAYEPGFQLIRDSSLVATDLPRALADPQSRFNVVLQAGDSLHLPEYDPTVLVTGAVTFESRILYVPGKGLDYYINGAGGFTHVADRGRVVVGYQDGERAGVSRVLVFKSKPTPGPGSTIYVPEKPPAQRAPFNWGELISRTTMVLGSIATLVIAVRR